MSRTLLLTGLLAASFFNATAQYNDKGTFHAAIGIGFGGHATEYEQTLRVGGLTFSDRTTDGAATVTFPIQAQYGLARIFSLGLYLEPGTYLDSSATRSNGMALVGIEPRFYLVNKDRFAWMASLQLGGSALRIDDNENGVSTTARYAGPQFGIGTGVAFQFSDLFGLQLHLRSVGTRMKLRNYETAGTTISSDDFEAELRTQGVVFQISAGFRF